MKFLANTGFLFQGLAFPARIRAAAAAGFDGVEFHDEIQRHDAAGIADLIAETGLAVGGLNTRMGATAGVAAMPGCEQDFGSDVRAAHAAAETVKAVAIHILAGRGDTQRGVYVANLRRALDLTDRQILIEPICRSAIPDYHLQTLDDALDVVSAVGNPRVAVMFDWYHVVAEIGYAEAADALERHKAMIGHVQAASFPERNEPEPTMIERTRQLGYQAIGFEYRPTMQEQVAVTWIRTQITL